MALVERRALQAVGLLAERAVELVSVWCFALEVVVALRVGAFFHAWDLISGPFPLEFAESLVFFLCQTDFDVPLSELFAALVVRALEREVCCVDLSSDVLSNAVDMVDVFATAQDDDLVGTSGEQVVEANIAWVLGLFLALRAGILIMHAVIQLCLVHLSVDELIRLVSLVIFLFEDPEVVSWPGAAGLVFSSHLVVVVCFQI